MDNQRQEQEEHEAAVMQALEAVRMKCGDGTASVIAEALGPRFAQINSIGDTDE